jgi:aspartyl/glutamyl-tRNA(Asn/Gln) amidotransferase C subunit
MISKEEVQHIAKLARLGLSKKDVEKFQKELSSILDYVEKLEEVDISNVEPTSHPFEVENVARKDQGEEPDEIKNRRKKKILGMAPDNEENYLKVKSIF